MTKRREIWFERVYPGVGVSWRPIHPNGWRAVFVLAGGLSILLLAAMILPVLKADPSWTLAIMIACLVLPAWFLWTVRGRVR